MNSREREAFMRAFGRLGDMQPRPKNAPPRVVYYPPCGEFPESRCRNEYYPCLPGKCPMGGQQ